jgi:hypothetical protein
VPAWLAAQSRAAQSLFAPLLYQRLEINSEGSAMDHRFGKFFIVSVGKRPPLENEALILDTNVVNDLSNWATRVTAVPASELHPFLSFMRDPAIKIIEPFWGALESSWTLHKGTGVPLNAHNYDEINASKFRESLIAVETIRCASEGQIKAWLHPDRRGSIEFLGLDASRFAEADLTSSSVRGLSELIISEWYAFMTLINSMSVLKGDESRDDLVDRYLWWRGDVQARGVPLRSMVQASAMMAFFGGAIEHRYWDVAAKTRRIGRVITRDTILKRDEWDTLGVAKVARNLAFDAMLFHRRNELESGLRQAAEDLRMERVQPVQTAIVTRDVPMSALNQLIVRSVGIPNHLNGQFVEFPTGSLISNGPEDETIHNRLTLAIPRSPYDLPVNDELIPLLIDQLAADEERIRLRATHDEQDN